MTLSIATTSIPGDLRSKLEQISAAGFQGVELHEPDFTGFNGSAKDVRNLAQDLGLKITLLQPFYDFEGLSGDHRSLAFQRAESKFDLMQELGTDLLLLGSSTHPDAIGDLDSILADFSELAERAQKRDLRIALLALPWARNITSDTQALDVVKQVASPNFGLALNSFFSLADGSKPARLRDVSGKQVFHVQLADAPVQNFNAQNLKRHFGLLPGQGGLNLASFVRVIAKNGYRGSWSLSRIGDAASVSASKTVAIDGYRSLVNLLDEAARNEPDLNFDIPELPERVSAIGIEFIEFAANNKSGEVLKNMLDALCFRMERRHISKSVELWRQGAINIVVNTEKEGFARTTFDDHGPSVCDMGLRVKDAVKTAARAKALGAPLFSQPVGTGELDIPAIRGVGGNIVHFIDEKSDLHRVWDIEFNPVRKTKATPPAGLRRIDHIAQTMKYEDMQSWMLFYISTFEMEKSSIVDVADPSGVVRSQVIASPEGEVRLNLNGAESRRTFAGAFLSDHLGAGVQHIALLTDDIFETSNRLMEAGFPRLEISPNYYSDLQSTLGLDEDFVAKLQAGNILYTRNKGEYFQIYSAPIFDGFFFEIVERRNGYQGYGAKNAPIRLAAQMKYLRNSTGAVN
ncbi:MAG: TIM barrel protein [Paracoccaceae bacterium]|jgi:4-hydroxyphenylpyruvate dioxygenase